MYGSVVDADSFFNLRLYTGVWDNSTTDLKTKALSQSSQRIDQLNFIGDKTDSDQDAEFPRDSDTEVPRAIIEATYLCAIAFLEGVDTDKEMNQARVTSQSIDTVKQTYDANQFPVWIASGIPSQEAWNKLRPYLRDSSSITLRRVS